MTDLAPLLARLAARYRLGDGLWRFTRAAWLAPLAALLLLAAARTRPLGGDRLWALGLAAAVLVALALRAWRRRVDPLTAAMRTDRALGLKDRLATAWLLAMDADRADTMGRLIAESGNTIGGDGGVADPSRAGLGGAHRALHRDLVVRQRADALAAAQGLDLRQVAPLRWARRPLVAFALLSAGVLALLLLPNPQHEELARRTAVKAASRTLAAEVRQREEALVDQNQLAEADRQQASAALRALAEQLDRSDGRAEADLAALAEAEAVLRRGLDREAGDALRREAEAQGLSERLSALSREARQDASDGGDGAAEASAEKLAADLQRLAATAVAADQPARDALAQTLRQEAQAAALHQPKVARQLEAVAGALEQGDQGAARRAAQELSASLDAVAAAATGARAMQDALSALQSGRSAIAQANAAGQPVEVAAVMGGGQPPEAGGADGAQGTRGQDAAAAQGAAAAQSAASGRSGSPDASAMQQGQAAGAPGASALQGEGGGQTAQGSGPSEALDQVGSQAEQGSDPSEAPGQGAGQSGQPGASSSGAGAAQGPRLTASPAAGMTAGQGVGGGDGGGGDGFSRSGQAAGLVYAPPQRLGPDGERSFVPGRIAGDQGSGRQSEQPSRRPGLAPAARVPYREVFPAYRDAAGRALARETIPLFRRDYVRAYFALLEE